MGDIENIYAEPLRDIGTIKVLVEIAMLNQDYQAAHKWIAQAMVLCDDQTLYASLYQRMVFVLCHDKTISDSLTPMHCIKRANEQKESKEALFARILMLCEDDKLEAAEPYMNKLSEQYPKDPFVAILRGLFEHLMEEVEDAQSIWQQQFDTINVRND